jgi:hypothetical protein
MGKEPKISSQLVALLLSATEPENGLLERTSVAL